ncbi:hypothetical protein FACUT_11645 [Fusarium acutatum]|uniref:Uncharacterized protein n=1 Tax=Fusarium acutatum TaxID=78861 RepID=A0A8H4JFB7_9HYPO|nr:hypothetical protein FACUT_11645 [Fusarium acutatum]
MSYTFPCVDIPPRLFDKRFELHEAIELWTPEEYADGVIFDELARMPLDALLPPTPVQDTASNQDITPSTTASNNDHDPYYIFDEAKYRIDHGFPYTCKLELYMPLTRMTHLRDHKTSPTATKLLVLVDVHTQNKWTYGWAVTFSAQYPLNAFNRGGDFASPGGRRAEACVHAFCEAINAIIDFANDETYEKPRISNICVRVPQFWDSKYALSRIFREVEQGITFGENAPQWLQDMYGTLAKSFYQMQKLRDEGVNIMLWQKTKKRSQ